MNNDNHGVLHGSSLPEGIAPRHDLESFFWCLWCDRGFNPPPPFCLLQPFFIVVSFLLNWIPSADTCLINPSLQLLGVVVKAEKYDYVRYKTLNAIMAAFPSDISIFSVVLFYFSTFPVPWNNLECHYQ